jgi:hypothetical protein
MTKSIYYFISLFFVFGNHCFAQNEKLKISSIVNSMYFPKGDSLIKKNKKKMFFFMSIGKDERNKLEDYLIFDLFDSKKFQLIYGNDKKKILKKLKHIEHGNVIDIKIINREINELELSVNISNTDYDLFSKMQFKVVTMDSDWEIHYTFKNGKWVTTKMICHGF